jgi:hypothetical protein
MTLRFVDSFDHYATADLTKKWTSTLGTVEISAGNGRDGTACLRGSAAPNATRTFYVQRTLAAQATWIVGVAFKPSNDGIEHGIFTLLDGVTLHCDLRRNGDGTLKVTRNGTTLGTSVATISAGSWYYVELKATISDAAGVAVVRLNGAEILNLSGVDTRNGGNASANVIRLGTTSAWASLAVQADFDDLYICDAQGAANSDFLGDVRVEALLPSGAGNSAQWTPSAGANYACVDDTAPDGDTTYVASSTAGHKDTYALGDLVSTAGTIFGVQTNLVGRKDDAGSRTVRPVLRLSGTEATGATTGLSDSYLDILDIFETAPGGGAWDMAGVNGAEAGVELVA